MELYKWLYGNDGWKSEIASRWCANQLHHSTSRTSMIFLIKQNKARGNNKVFLFFSFLKQIFISYLCIFICMKKYCCKNFSIPDAKITFFFLFQFFQFFHSHLCAQSKKKKTNYIRFLLFLSICFNIFEKFWI